MLLTSLSESRAPPNPYNVAYGQPISGPPSAASVPPSAPSHSPYSYNHPSVSSAPSEPTIVRTNLSYLPPNAPPQQQYLNHQQPAPQPTNYYYQQPQQNPTYQSSPPPQQQYSNTNYPSLPGAAPQSHYPASPPQPQGDMNAKVSSSSVLCLISFSDLDPKAL